MVKIYTKYGDEGETGLLYGGRVSKADPRAEAYGTADEAVSALGLAKALSENPLVRSIVDRLQRELFTVGAELATDPAHYDKLLAHFSAVTPEMVEEFVVTSRLDFARDEIHDEDGDRCQTRKRHCYSVSNRDALLTTIGSTGTSW